MISKEWKTNNLVCPALNLDLTLPLVTYKKRHHVDLINLHVPLQMGMGMVLKSLCILYASSFNFHHVSLVRGSMFICKFHNILKYIYTWGEENRRWVFDPHSNYGRSVIQNWMQNKIISSHLSEVCVLCWKLISKHYCMH